MYKWDEMTPPERDLLIAKEVLKWEVLENVVIPSGWTKKIRCPQFSAEILLAWEVLEKSISDGWEPHISYSNVTKSWYVSMRRWINNKPLSGPSDYDHPEKLKAIYMTVLRAYGVEII